MTYPEALRYFDSFVNYETKSEYDYRKSLGLERIAKLCALLGNPQDSIRSMHVAGTKGKGSTSAFIYYILRAAGYTVGLYTSPHLVSFRERIRVDGELISESDIGRLADTLKDSAQKMAGEALSFFELYTALAYLYFKERRVDFAVYEVGLGGRLDATNIINPLVSVITPISYEHTDKLGGSLARIAFEKGGIIKKGITCVSSPQKKEAEDEIKNICLERGSKLVMVGRDVIYKELHADERAEHFEVTGRLGQYKDLKTGLLGSHQIANAATAIAAAEVLKECGINIKEDAIVNGIAGARWEGRVEVAGHKPYVILDGAQNRSSAEALANTIRKIFRYRKLYLVLGVSTDKDIKGILEELLPLADEIFLTKANIPERAMEPARIREFMGSGGFLRRYRQCKRGHHQGLDRPAKRIWCWLPVHYLW